MFIVMRGVVEITKGSEAAAEARARAIAGRKLIAGNQVKINCLELLRTERSLHSALWLTHYYHI